MKFNLGNALTGAGAGGLTGGWAGAAAGFLGGGTTDQNYNKVSRSDVRMGHSEDTRSFKERDIYSWNQAKSRGLTPQEFYGSSASGGSSSSGGANVLGNSQDKQQQLKQQQSQETSERQKDRITQIAQTKMQTDTQKQVAEIQTGTTRRGQDITQSTAAKALSLSREQLNLSKQTVAAQLKISEQQLVTATNQTITSAPKWQRMMKLLTMGPDNVFATAYMEMEGIDPTMKGGLDHLTKLQKKRFLDGLIAYKSRTAGEISGLARLFGLSNPSENTYTGPPTLGAGNKKKKVIYSNPFFTINKYE